MQKYCKYWKHGSNNAWKQHIILWFCFKGTLRPNNSVQVYDSIEWQKHLIIISRGRKAKLPKLLKVGAELLSAELLFTTFTFDLVLTATYFVLHYIKGFELNCFTLKYIWPIWLNGWVFVKEVVVGSSPVAVTWNT